MTITRTAPRNGRLAPSAKHLASIDGALDRIKQFQMRAPAGVARLSDLVGGSSRMSAGSPEQQNESVPAAAPLSDGDRIASLEARVSVLEKQAEKTPPDGGHQVAPADPTASARAVPTATLDTAAVFARFNAKAVRPDAGRRPGQSA